MRRTSTGGRLFAYVDNLRRVRDAHGSAAADRTDTGRSWYSDQRRALCVIAGAVPDDLESTAELWAPVTAAAAMLSPSTSWGGVMRRMPEFIADARSGVVMPHFPAYGRNRRAAARILRGESRLVDECSGPKVLAFALNLRSGGADRGVTVDRHMLSMARGRPIGHPQACTLTEYREVEAAVQLLSAEPNPWGFATTPPQFQAILWTLEVGPMGRAGDK